MRIINTAGVTYLIWLTLVVIEIVKSKTKRDYDHIGKKGANGITVI